MRKLLLMVMVVLAAPVGAATFTVDFWGHDSGDLVPGDGLCEWATIVPVGQRCTLRAAIMEANALPGSHIILVPSGAHIVLSRLGRNEDAGALGDLDITRSVLIGSNASGDARPIIDANGIDRVFDIHASAGNVVLTGLQITRGLANSADTFLGGGIRSLAGALTVDNCDIRGNSANAGGGLYVSSNTVIFRSSLHNNIAANYGYSNPEGSALFAAGGVGLMTIESSSVTDNLAMLGTVGTRAAIEAHGITELRILDSTVSGNSPNGIYVHSSDRLVFNHLTLIGDSAGGVGLRVYRFSGGFSSDINNSVIAGYGTGCQFTGGGIYSYSHNYTLSGDSSCWLGGFGIGNLIGVDPRLHPLSLDDWTGTRVHHPRGGSPVIDRGDPLIAPTGSCRATDQIGRWRPLDGDNVPGARCDMGAVEYDDVLFANGFENLIG